MLTREQILAASGVQLRIWVAETLLGWEKVEPPKEAPHVELWEAPNGEIAWAEELPHVDEDIAAAWQVVEKLRRTHNVAIIIDDYDDQWRVQFENRSGMHAVYDDSLPSAICKAALLTAEGAREEATT